MTSRPTAHLPAPGRSRPARGRLGSAVVVTALSASFLAAPVSLPSPASALTEATVPLPRGSLSLAGEKGIFVRAPFAYTMLAISYLGQISGLEVRPEGGERPGTWVDLELDDTGGQTSDTGDEGPVFTNLVWTGIGAAARIRGREAVRGEGLMIHFYDHRGVNVSSPPGTAHAASSISSRRQWGANDSLRGPGCTHPHYGRVRGAIVHHTATGNDYQIEDVAGILRAIQHFHVTRRGFCDIGYNFIIDRFGRAFEGARGGIDRAVIGTHSGPYNAETTGVSLLGDYSSDAPPRKALDALARLLAWKLRTHGVLARSWVRYPTGVRLPAVAGHADTKATACPGRIRNLLPALRLRVAEPVTHPTGTFIRAGRAVFLVVGRTKRLVSPAVLSSRAAPSEAVAVDRRSLARYRSGKRLGFRDGALVRGPDGVFWVISGGQRRRFSSREIFEVLGYSQVNLIPGSWNELALHPLGAHVVDPSRHPDGTVVRSRVQGSTYLLEHGRRRPILSRGTLLSAYRPSEVIVINDAEMALYPRGRALRWRDGSLLGSGGRIYAISGGRRRPFGSQELFWAMGYDPSNVREGTNTDVTLHPPGSPVSYRRG